MTAQSRQLAGLIGPSLLVISITEAINMDIFAAQAAPVVYLNGTALFVGGLAIVRTHNRWPWNWTVLVTLSGWAAVLLGLYRMIFPGLDQAGDNLTTYVVLAGIFIVGAVLSAGAFFPRR